MQEMLRDGLRKFWGLHFKWVSFLRKVNMPHFPAWEEDDLIFLNYNLNHWTSSKNRTEVLHQNINFTSISWFNQCKLPIFLGCCFLFCNRKNNLSPNMYYILQCVFSLWIREKYAALVSGSCQTSFRYELKRILSAYVTLRRFMAAGYFSFYMKNYVNILRWCGIRTSCGIFKALWDQNHKRNTNAKWHWYIKNHLQSCSCFCIETAHKMFSSMPSRNSFKDDLGKTIAN